MKTRTIISLLLLQGIVLQAQSFKDDFGNMLSLYKEVNNLYVEMENKVYKGSELEKESSSIIRKKGASYLYHLAEHSMLINNDYVVLVDKRNYNIVFDKFTLEQAEKLEKVQMPVREDLLKVYKEVSYKGTKNKLKHYHLENEKETIYKMDLYFDVNTGFIRRAVYYHNPKLIPGDMRSEIYLKVINIKPTFSEEAFSEKQFVTIKNGEGIAARAYTKYSVRNAAGKPTN